MTWTVVGWLTLITTPSLFIAHDFYKPLSLNNFVRQGKAPTDATQQQTHTADKAGHVTHHVQEIPEFSTWINLP